MSKGIVEHNHRRSLEIAADILVEVGTLGGGTALGWFLIAAGGRDAAQRRRNSDRKQWQQSRRRRCEPQSHRSVADRLRSRAKGRHDDCAQRRG